jgi:O-antigen/teichoic acid export membrane protein
LSPLFDLKNLAANSVYLFAGQVFGLLLNLATFILMARYLDEASLGVFSYGLVVVGFFALLPDFGMKPILVREASRSGEGNGFLEAAFTLKVILSSVAVAGVLVFAGLTLPRASDRIVFLVLSFTILISSKTNSIRSPFESILNARLESGHIVLSQLIDYGFQLTLIVSFILIRASSIAILSAYVFSNLAGLIYIGGVSLKQGFRFRLHPDWKKSLWVIRESLPLMIYLILVLFLDRFDVFLIRHFGGDAAVGVYSGAYRLIAPLSFLPYAITYSLLPVFSAHGQGGETRRYFEFGLKILFWIGMWIALATATVGRELFLSLFGGKFSAVSSVFQMLAISQMAYFMVFFLIDYCNSQNRQIIGLLAVGIGAVLAIPLQVLLIGRFGLAGAGFAKNLMYAMNLALLAWIVRRVLPETYKPVLFKTVLAVFMTMAVLIAVVQASTPFFLRLVLLLGGSALVMTSRTFREGMLVLRRVVHDKTR